jgi:hypothetical protein
MRTTAITWLTRKHGPTVLEEVPLPDRMSHFAVAPVVDFDYRSRHTIRSLDDDLDPLEDGKVDGLGDVAAQGRMEVELHSDLYQKQSRMFSIVSKAIIGGHDERLTSARQADRARIRTRNQTMAPRGKVMRRTVPTSVPAIKMGQRTSICGRAAIQLPNEDSPRYCQDSPEVG